jgi:hypothetical protein
MAARRPAARSDSPDRQLPLRTERLCSQGDSAVRQILREFVSGPDLISRPAASVR